MVTAPGRLDNLRTLRVGNIDVAFATAFVTLTTGSFLVGFVKHVGGTDLWVGLLSAIPSLLGILQIPGAIWGRSFPSFKRFIVPGGWLWRVFFIPVVALPVLPIPNEAKLWMLGLCLALASASILLIQPIYNDWMAEMVPPGSRGWYFSRRAVIGTAVGATMGTVGGLVLDAFRRADRADEGYAVIFGLGWVCSLISMLVFLQMRDIPRPNPIRQTLSQGIAAFRVPLRDLEFRKVLIFLGATVFAQVYAGNLFAAFALESLGLSFTVIQLAAAAHAVGQIAFAKIWGYLADKYGNKPILVLVGLLLTLSPVMWIFCEPGQDARNAAILIPGHVFSGMVWSGIALCQLNLLLATSNPNDRANYLGVGMALQAIIGGISPLIGAETMRLLREVMSAEAGYKTVFGITMVLRVLAVMTLGPVREAGAVGIREALGHLRRVTPKGYAALRTLNRSQDPETRGQAIQSVATEQMSLAADEIIRALHDPSPQVRRHASLALAKIGGRKAVEGMIHQLEEHPDLVEEETIEALGELGDPLAVEALLGYLRSPRAVLRRAAARALGRIPDPRSAEPLLEAASQIEDTDLRRASLQALRHLNAPGTAVVAAQALHDPAPSVRIAAAELVAELELTAAIQAVRASLNLHDDEAQSEVIYALGRIGTLEDLPTLLEHAGRMRSLITRRRTLLGVARLLGVEREVYRLFLSEGFERDTVLLELLQGASRRSKRYQVALERYSNGDEPGALEALAKASKRPELETMSRHPVEELFLVAAAYVRSLESGHSARNAART